MPSLQKINNSFFLLLERQSCQLESPTAISIWYQKMVLEHQRKQLLRRNLLYQHSWWNCVNHLRNLELVQRQFGPRGLSAPHPWISSHLNLQHFWRTVLQLLCYQSGTAVCVNKQQMFPVLPCTTEQEKKKEKKNPFMSPKRGSAVLIMSIVLCLVFNALSKVFILASSGQCWRLYSRIQVSKSQHPIFNFSPTSWTNLYTAPLFPRARSWHELFLALTMVRDGHITHLLLMFSKNQSN